MGDRTSVTLTVLTSQKGEAERIALQHDYEAEHVSSSENLTFFSYYEVNYGELHFLSDLTNAGIAFDSDWDHGSEYGSGREFMRFTPEGEAKGFSYSDEYHNPDLNRCMALLDEPEALKAYILDHHSKVTPLPWDNQEQYGKIFRTKNLIT
jgi:hypothetical protein